MIQMPEFDPIWFLNLYSLEFQTYCSDTDTVLGDAAQTLTLFFDILHRKGHCSQTHCTARATVFKHTLQTLILFPYILHTHTDTVHRYIYHTVLLWSTRTLILFLTALALTLVFNILNKQKYCSQIYCIASESVPRHTTTSTKGRLHGLLGGISFLIPFVSAENVDQCSNCGSNSKNGA